MKNIFFIVFSFLFSICFSQESSSFDDIKIGSFQNKNTQVKKGDNNELRTFDIFASLNSLDNSFNIYIDVAVDYISDKGSSGSGFMLTSDQLDMFFNTLLSSKKQFQSLLNRGKIDKDVRLSIGRDVPSGFYRWSKTSTKSVNRDSGDSNKKYPLSVQFVSSNQISVLWIGIRGIKSNGQDVGLVFASVKELDLFIDLLNPGHIKKKVYKNKRDK